MTRAGLAAMVILVSVFAGGVLAAPPPGSSLQDRRVYYADELIEHVGKGVERDHACRPRPPERGPVDGAPSAAFRNSLAALRRPAVPEDQVDLRQMFPAVPSIYSGYTRVIRTADGVTVTVFPLHDVSVSSPRPSHCVAALRQGVRRAISSRRRAFRRVALLRLRSEISREWAPRQLEGMIVLFDGSGTVAALHQFRSHGVLTYGGGPVHDLVPDGVATIDFTFRRFEPTGYWSKHHPVTLRATASVQDNVASLETVLSLRDSWVARQVWRAADGSVIRVISG